MALRKILLNSSKASRTDFVPIGILTAKNTQGAIEQAEAAIAVNVIAIEAKNSYPSEDATKVSYISVSQAVNLDTMESDIAANNSKISYTEAAAVAANTSHRGVVSGNPHAVTKAEIGLGNVPNVDTTNASNISTGTLPSAVLPPIALVKVQPAVSQIAMLALTTQEGDVVVRSDENKTYMRNAGVAGTMADFTELQTPTDTVLSVNGEIGTVVISTGDISEDINKNFVTDADQSKLIGIEASAEVNNISDINATDLTDAGDSALHYHSTDRARGNHTGTQPASTISDFDTEVSNNLSVAANTTKVSNVSHTGDVTGSGALTIGADKVKDTHIDFGILTGQVSTADLPESGNLYYTEARVSANASVAANTAKISYTAAAAVAANTSKVSYPGSASAAELNILDGALLTTIELNYVDGVTSAIQTQLDGKAATHSHPYNNYVHPTSHTASQISDFDTEVSNNTSVAANTTKISYTAALAVAANTAKVSYPGSASAAELNILDGALLTTIELNYVDGVTSAIQTQLDGKAATHSHPYNNYVHPTSHTASQISDFDTEVSNNTSVAANTTKISYTAALAVAANTAKVSYPGSASAAELNILDGALLTTIELNYVDGVTSAIQTQLNGKSATHSHPYNNYVHPASHAISVITGLQTALDGKSATHTHPYNDYTHPASHAISFITNLQTTLDGKSPTHSHPYNDYSHPTNHAISVITGLQTALDGKSATHSHPYAPTVHSHNVWQTKTASFTASKDISYFVNTTSLIVNITLPSSPAIGDTVRVCDVAGNFNTNKAVFLCGLNKIMGLAENSDMATQYLSTSLVYSDATNGWRYVG